MYAEFDDIKSCNDYDVCVVGAGPVGIAFALAGEARGLSVLMLESGLASTSEFATSLSASHIIQPETHASPSIAMRRAMGGASKWWGGRCVPFDEVDFSERWHGFGKWPMSYADVAAWHEEAAKFFGIGSSVFRSMPTNKMWENMEDVKFEDLERWAPELDLSKRHRARLAASKSITVVLGATVTSIDFLDNMRTVAKLTVANSQQVDQISPKQIVIACGGLETTRLMLSSQQKCPGIFGGPEGALGKYYMGHMSGKIADLIVDATSSIHDHDFFLDEDVYVRRRLTIPAATQNRERLLNVVFWADNPPFHAAEHKSSLLSLAWLVLACPPLGRLLTSEGVRVSHVGPAPHRRFQHFCNVARDPVRAVCNIIRIFYARYCRHPRTPGFLIRNRAGRYALHYHSEQLPRCTSYVSLGARVDALGVPFLKVTLRFSEADARAIIDAHVILDRSMRKAKCGRIEFYDANPQDRLVRVMAQATDGFHQIGTTRMGIDKNHGVVDSNCRVHGVDNLYLASSSVFPSSGQAGPTFLAVALAIRLAEHIFQKGAKKAK